MILDNTLNADLHKVYLSTGSNIGDRLNTLHKAKSDIERYMGAVKSESSIYESEAWGFESEQNFLNQILLIESRLSPKELLNAIARIENEHGRVRTNSSFYTSRTLDIDIVFYDDAIICEENIEIPHAKLHERLFVLLPLVEIAPDLRHPVFHYTVKEMLDRCKDTGKIERLTF
jgi:2-amino-4-hydroxy-6-hydroxymethyldihydropteridine diphosphokinase